MPKLALAALCLALAGCTSPWVRDTSAIDAQTAKCETEDCVIRLMDTLPQGPDSERYPFMEGQPDTPLAELKAKQGLTVAYINPFLFALGFYGMAYFETYPLGGIKRCDVQHIPGFNWLSLKHELAHCQGYADHGIPLMPIGYTPEQQAIMTREGVTRWTDTSIYRKEKDRG